MIFNSSEVDGKWRYDLYVKHLMNQNLMKTS